MIDERTRKLTQYLPAIERQVPEEVGELIRRARTEKNLSQAELAELLGRRQAYISDLENGKTEPSATLLMQLCLLLGQPITYFFQHGWMDAGQPPLKPDELSTEEAALFERLRQLEQGFDYHLAMRILNTMVDVSQEDEHYFRRVM
jgi:transcriptional regulator with XRE-family HTH domain